VRKAERTARDLEEAGKTHAAQPVGGGKGTAVKAAHPPRGKWHFFLSHTQRNGDAKTLAADLYHVMKDLGYKCWLDVKMPKQDEDAMKEGVEHSDCVLAIITGGDRTDYRYFERPLCVQELQWAIDAGKVIVPVVPAGDKPKVGEYISEGQAKWIDLSGCDFKHVDRSNQIMMHASLQTILDATKSTPKARNVPIVAGNKALAPAPAPAPAALAASAEEVLRAKLAELNLSQFADKLITNGFDSLAMVAEMTDDELNAAGMGPGHKKKIRNQLLL
jgi:hypothetical protein